MGVEGEEAVEEVVGDIDASVGEPAGEGRVMAVENDVGEAEPLYFPRLLLPVVLPEFRRGCSAVCFLVGVFYHKKI